MQLPTLQAVAAGHTGRCHLTVTNNGPGSASQPDAAISLPPGVYEVSCSNRCTQNGTTYSWARSAQAVGASRTFTLKVKAVKAGTDEVAGQASAATRDPDPGNNFASATITIRRH